jgi:molybdopterin synthase sulfur carrier subunit
MAVEPATLTVTVRLPSQLYQAAGGRRAIVVPAGTARDMIASLEAEAPGMRFHLCDETGDLRSFVNIFLDGVNIRNLGGLQTLIPAGASVAIYPSVAGG